MKSITILIALMLATIIVNGQELYIKTFGEPTDEAIVFLHGGPGYNCANFEATTAQELADNGFYVIVYDRRGEGRSTDADAKFTFKETFKDIKFIYKRFRIKKATLMGHSFGGIVATLFAEKYPKKVNSIILVSAPVSLQESFKTIINTSKEIYKTKDDSLGLKRIANIEKMDTTSLVYSSVCFNHAIQNGFYSPKEPTEEAQSLYGAFSTDPLITEHASVMTFQAPEGFWRNEEYTSIDLTTSLVNVQATGIKIYGLYGKDDGLYSNEQVLKLQSLIGDSSLIYFDNCSHSVFIDQQTEFIHALINWLR